MLYLKTAAYSSNGYLIFSTLNPLKLLYGAFSSVTDLVSVIRELKTQTRRTKGSKVLILIRKLTDTDRDYVGE